MAKFTFDEVMDMINDCSYVESDDVLTSALNRQVWVASNGMAGCLNDHSTICLTKHDAIEQALFIADLGEGPTRGMKTSLRQNHYFYEDGYAYRIEKMLLRDLL